MTALTEAGLLREVARVQHDKTLQAVRDLIDRLPTIKPGGRNNWDSVPVQAKEFRDALVAALIEMREQR